MGLKTVKLYEVREWVGASYSKQLGRRLRGRNAALRVVKRLKERGREVFASQLAVTTKQASV